MKNDHFAPMNIRSLFLFINHQSDEGFRLGIPRTLFFKPEHFQQAGISFLGHYLSTPIGVAAGPHTQLAANIIAAWLCGARYMELKTVQELDNIAISKPCIDMQDEGYNCEWSQELSIAQSYEEYLKAWILIHWLAHNKGMETHGCVFNMSIGYDLKGILSGKVQWFLNKMKDCSLEKSLMIQELKDICPEIADINIPDCISDNITLSTMHGCPPDEIERIASYLLSEKKLHTLIKLNPTLLGAEKLRNILNENSGFKTWVPDQAFAHDLKYEDAVGIIGRLQQLAARESLFFGVKLTNTLESENLKGVFSPDEKMAYMSGYALHPLSINLASKLQNDFQGNLHISFSGGADCFNIADILKCGIYPVTVCSDLLKPGGYGRLHQYLLHLKKSPELNTLSEYLNGLTPEDRMNITQQYTLRVQESRRYRKTFLHEPDIKSERVLTLFDCIHAPCVSRCPATQNIPVYLFHTANRHYSEALKVILETNALPNVCGMVCDHACEGKCTRMNYDHSLRIRDVKRFIAETQPLHDLESMPKNGLKVAVIGAGPSGLSCSYHLALAGFQVKVFESNHFAGGMVSDTIPAFRIDNEAVQRDIEKIIALGVDIQYNTHITSAAFGEILASNEYVFLAVGAQKSKKLNIPGEDASGVLDSLQYLSALKKGNNMISGKNIAVIGAGNTAMDVARAAKRAGGKDVSVSIVYRRSLQDMPAESEEIRAAISDGINIIEYTSPVQIESSNGKASGLLCVKMQPGPDDSSGRPQPIKIEGSEHFLEFDTIIPAGGQESLIDFTDAALLKTEDGSFRTKIRNLFIGGDLYRGASNIIHAVADGRRAAEEITADAALSAENAGEVHHKEHDLLHLMQLRALRHPPKGDSEHFNPGEISETLTPAEAGEEAGRCLYCDELCNICVTVCPNRAYQFFVTAPQSIFLQKAVLLESKEIVFEDDVPFDIQQKYQVYNIADLCNECGNCTTFCPTSGSPFKDKARLFMNIEKFNASGYGYLLSRKHNKIILIKKIGDQISTLSLSEGKYLYENDAVFACFMEDGFDMIHVRFLDTAIKEYHFDEAAVMMVLLQAFAKLSF